MRSNVVATPDRVRDKAYGPGEEKALRRDLLALDRANLFYPVRSVNELLFVEDSSPAARTVTGFTVSPRALTQVCTLLARGLNTLVRDLCGADHTPGSARAIYSPLEAKRLYNCVLRRRFTHRLSTVSILRSGTLIRAVVGGSYNRLPHSDFLDTVSTLAREKSELDFSNAVLTAGILKVRYFQRASYLRHGEDEFLAGWQFTNGETGLASASVVALLAHKPSLLASRWSRTRTSTEESVRHDAADLPIKLAHCFRQATAALWLPDRLSTAIARAKSMTLGLGCRRHDADDRRRNAIAAALVYCGGHRWVPSATARAVVESAAAYGSSLTPDLSPDRRELASRSVFDLVLALGREARTAAPAVAGRMETAAREVLTGHFLLPPVEAEVKAS
jgi:hypothetical protein